VTLWSHGKKDWDLVDGAKAKAEEDKKKQKDELNKSRTEDEPVVLDINEEGGRVMDAEFEERPKKK